VYLEKQKSGKCLKKLKELKPKNTHFFVAWPTPSPMLGWLSGHLYPIWGGRASTPSLVAGRRVAPLSLVEGHCAATPSLLLEMALWPTLFLIIIFIFVSNKSASTPLKN
jgi:hypothetical protein